MSKTCDHNHHEAKDCPITDGRVRVPFEALRVYMSEGEFEIPARAIIDDGFFYDPITRTVQLTLRAQGLEVVERLRMGRTET